MSRLPATQFINLVDRGSFLVRTAGPENAPAVVLLHGLGASAELNWSSVIPALSRDFRVVAPDIRGHGDTRTAERFDLEDAADDVVALADALSLDSFIVVGYSMGGAIAQLVCRDHGDRVQGLVLCATSRTFRQTWREHVMFAALPPARLAAWALPDDVVRATVRRVVARVVDGACDEAFDSGRALNVGSVLEATVALGAFDSRGWIDHLDVPSGVVVHLRDQLVPTGRQFALAHAMPQATVHPFDGDHFGVVKQPQVFVSTLQAALRSVQRRTCVPIALAG
jgi:pimeloyl-ACP methyl ester carboxylesterase